MKPSSHITVVALVLFNLLRLPWIMQKNGTATVVNAFVETNGWQYRGRPRFRPVFASAVASEGNNHSKNPRHTLAILAMPSTAWDRMVNDAILTRAVAVTTGGSGTNASDQKPKANPKLSVVLRCEGRVPPTTAALRRYVGEVYAQLWDTVMESTESSDNGSSSSQSSPPSLTDGHLLDVVVYPQNLPNAAPESWLDIQPDLDCVCSHDALCGWTSTQATGRGRRYQQAEGQGGVKAHVAALNRERASRGLPAVSRSVAVTMPVLVGSTQSDKDGEADNLWTDQVVFLEDDDDVESNVQYQMHRQEDEMDDQDLANGSSKTKPSTRTNGASTNLLGGARQSTTQPLFFDHVTVGGTFDGLHFGHRKLLTLAVSSVTPLTGRLMVGVTVDAMLTHKAYRAYLPSLGERMQGVRDFLQRLAPGMMK